MHQIQLLKKYGLSVRGVRGQHLLIDENIQRKFVTLVAPKPNETILEVGPGLGAITEPLLESGAKVVAVEQDNRFIEILKGELGQDYKNLTLVHSDILKVNLKKYITAKGKIKVVGNIPYYITSPILLYLIANRVFVDSAYLTVQREIADRIFAQPGTKSYGRLSILARFYAEVHRAFEISRHCFSPKPKVDSTVIELTFRQSLPTSVDEKILFALVKVGFGSRRKTVLNAMVSGLKGQITKQGATELLSAAGIKVTARAEELMLKDFIRLAELFKRGALTCPRQVC